MRTVEDTANPLEKDIEGPVTRFAESMGWRSMKLAGRGDRGKVDHVYYREGHCIVWIEFKAPGEKPRKLQQRWIDDLEHCGFEVYVIDDIEHGKAIFEDRS